MLTNTQQQQQQQHEVCGSYATRSRKNMVRSTQQASLAFKTNAQHDRSKAPRACTHTSASRLLERELGRSRVLRERLLNVELLRLCERVPLAAELLRTWSGYANEDEDPDFEESTERCAMNGSAFRNVLKPRAALNKLLGHQTHRST